jgi:thiamine-phosphate pyrophosphorylase
VYPRLPTRRPLLCYVTDRLSLAGSPELAQKLQLEKLEKAAKAGVDWIQIREKDLSGRELAKLSEHAIRHAESGSAILVNDRLDVALATGAAGVHLGEHSLPPDQAKKLMAQRGTREDFVVGASAHSLEEARQAEQAGADYIIFGPVYATPSKARFGPPQGIQQLKDLCRHLKIPVLAIGGIALKNAQDCIAAGAAGIAAIRLFQDRSDLDELVNELRKVS